VFGTMGRRAVESVVALFAVLGFCFVPLGSKTGFEHTLALLRTDTVQEALEGLGGAVGRARTLLVRSLLPEARPTRPLPIPTSSAPVRPVPPPLRADR